MSTVDDSEPGGSDAKPLRALDQYEVADGYPDIRGWQAIGPQGEAIGRIVELLVDTSALRVSQVVIDAGSTHRQVPIESVQIDTEGKNATITDMSAAREIPTHGDSRVDAVSTATGFRNEELIDQAAASAPGAMSDVEVEREPIMDGALRASDLEKNEVRLPALDAESLVDPTEGDEHAPPADA